MIKGLESLGDIQTSLNVMLENLAETMVKLLTFAASPGEGKVRIGGDTVIPVCKALVNVTILPDPPRAELVWQGMKEG